MSEEKRQLIRDVTTRINKLPVDKQHYILGYMNGVADTVESDTQKEEATLMLYTVPKSSDSVG